METAAGHVDLTPYQNKTGKLAPQPWFLTKRRGARLGLKIRNQETYRMPYITCKISDGLGNRFFQTSAMLGYAEAHGHEPVFVRDWIQTTNHVGPKSIHDYFPSIPVISAAAANGWVLADEPGDLSYTFSPLPHIPQNVKLNGYFQTEKYFPKGGVPVPASLPTSARFPSYAFLHVRRGDYLNPLCRHHYVELADYYRYALSLFSDSDTRILVCSDDIDWCRATLPARYADLIAADRWDFFSGNDHETLGAMVSCGRGDICANSTFSWWGAYWGFHRNGRRGIFTMPAIWGHPPLPTPVDLHPAWATVLPV